MHVRRRGRSVASMGVVVLTGVLCAAAFAAVDGDTGLLPGASIAAAKSFSPGEHPGVTAKRIAARARILATIPSDDISWPLHGEITGRFGEARPGHFHEGIDIPQPAGTPIRAASAGRVVMREEQLGYGKYTCVAHVTITTCYGHQSRFGTKLGAEVERGEVIGYVGNTGDTAFNHLHFEVRQGTRPWGKPMNPLKFLPRG